MESTPTIILGMVILALFVIFLVALLQGSTETKSIRATPSIAAEDGVLTCSASAIIQASVDEVFAVLLNYKDYSWASHYEYEWKAKDGIPVLGSTGTVKLSVDDFITRTINLKMTCLDHKTKMIAACATQYPRWLLGIEAVQQVLPVEGHKGICEFKSWATYEGIAAYFLLFTAKEELDVSQRQFVDDLKTFVEARGH